MMLSLNKAARMANKSTSVISNALERGIISGKKNDKGEWEIDPSELTRVYPMKSPLEIAKERNKTYKDNSEISKLGVQLEQALQQASTEQERRHELEVRLEKTEREAKEREGRLFAELEASRTEKKLLLASPLPQDQLAALNAKVVTAEGEAVRLRLEKEDIERRAAAFQKSAAALRSENAELKAKAEKGFWQKIFS